MQPCIYFNILYLCNAAVFFLLCTTGKQGWYLIWSVSMHTHLCMHSNIHVEIRPIKVKESKTDQSYPIKKWGNFDCTWSNLNRTWDNFNHQPIKVTRSVNKDINCHFFGVFFGMKNMWGNAWIKKSKVYLDL